MKNKILDELVDKGYISDYSYDNVDENGNIRQKSKFRNTERLVLVFPDMHELTIDTFCSGCAEDTTIGISLIN